MFRLEDYPEILAHLSGISTIFKQDSPGWYQMFCPFCDDATRKANPDHGHFHVASSFPFGHCFRCGIRVGLDHLLRITNFQNQDIINKIQRKSGVTHVNVKRTTTTYVERHVLYQNILSRYSDFYRSYPMHFTMFRDYIYTRCLDIDPIRFFIQPAMSRNQQNIGVNFLNYDGVDITTRFLSGPKRYQTANKGVLYYFQNIRNIDDYTDIVFTEGAFDLINLYNYCPVFTNAFFITFGGIYYKQNVVNVVKNHLLVGKYRIHVVFDFGVKHFNKIMYEIDNSMSVLNPEISTFYYIPPKSKDVSECMLLNIIER